MTYWKKKKISTSLCPCFCARWDLPTLETKKQPTNIDFLNRGIKWLSKQRKSNPLFPQGSSSLNKLTILICTLFRRPRVSLSITRNELNTTFSCYFWINTSWLTHSPLSLLWFAREVERLRACVRDSCAAFMMIANLRETYRLWDQKEHEEHLHVPPGVTAGA